MAEKNMEKRNAGGFTGVELMVVIAILSLLFAVVVPMHISSRNAAKEAEVKANLHTIQVVLERYATDCNGEYPDYILGGDIKGWNVYSGCRAVTMPMYEMMRPPTDPLIAFAYIDKYPRNPFLDEGDGVETVIFMTGASTRLGDGDVRFGYSGEIMGNCLDDPRVLFEQTGVPTRYQWTMYPVAGAYLSVLNSNSPNSFYCMGGFPQWSRDSMGASDPGDESIKYWWPGEFFYRAGGQFGEIDMSMGSENFDTIWRWPYKKIDKYMLGGYGSLRTDGLDVVRLTTVEGMAAVVQAGAISGVINGQFYQDHNNPGREASHPEFDVRVQYSNPEVFGGGGSGLMPQFPYYEERTHRWIYGAPDGYQDGIILVLTGKLGEDAFLEWGGGAE